ncbi:DgyrCDS11391 [Dimorphilus gyrociliatus]|uniref:DgyrCDS11391 n=1 Tax=Dimorphilus gyrociliatus TaxID=2664684 RepID=A0A7I8W3B8_9ANNE|nr:DgyrCDS11391 [Dimorphilus gyrociliatus]
MNSEDRPNTTNQPPKTILSFVLDHSEEEKEQNDGGPFGKWHSIINLLGILYTKLIILAGIALPITEALRAQWYETHYVAAFYVYLYGVSILFLIWLLFSLRKTDHKVKHQVHENRAFSGNRSTSEHSLSSLEHKSSNLVLQRVDDPSRRISQYSLNGGVVYNPTALSYDDFRAIPEFDTISNTVGETTEEIKEYICYHTTTATMSHEGSSFYLRLGAIIFALANLIYLALEVEQKYGEHPKNCTSKQVIYPVFVHIVFILLQTFFLFKHNKIHPDQGSPIVFAGLLHIIGTNFCVWMRYLVREVEEGVHMADHANDKAGNGNNCSSQNSLVSKASPYLFPFVLEYSLIAAATMMVMSSELTVRVTSDLIEKVRKQLKKNQQLRKRASTISKPSQHIEEGVEFQKAHTGMFTGIVFLAVSVIGMILFLNTYNKNKTDKKDLAIKIHHCFDIGLNLIMAIASILSMIRLMSKLSYSYSSKNGVDQGLIILSSGGGILLNTFMFIAAVTGIFQNDNRLVILKLRSAQSFLGVIQTLIQTTMIIDGLQRYSKTQSQQQEKPGRNHITFLIVANLGMWLFKMVQLKQLGLDRQREFFGKLAWAIVLNVCLPLQLFFHFHSTVCLADIWVSAYEPDADHNVYIVDT